MDWHGPHAHSKHDHGQISDKYETTTMVAHALRKSWEFFIISNSSLLCVHFSHGPNEREKNRRRERENKKKRQVRATHTPGCAFVNKCNLHILSFYYLNTKEIVHTSTRPAAIAVIIVPLSLALYAVHISRFTLNLNTRYVKRNIIKLRRTDRKRTHRKQKSKRKKRERKKAARRRTMKNLWIAQQPQEKSSIRLKILASTMPSKGGKNSKMRRKTHLLSVSPSKTKRKKAFFKHHNKPNASIKWNRKRKKT